MNTYGQAITQMGDIVFAGGDFKYMESAGGERVDQSYLADYNVDSGEPVRSFSASGSPSWILVATCGLVATTTVRWTLTVSSIRLVSLPSSHCDCPVGSA